MERTARPGGDDHRGTGETEQRELRGPAREHLPQHLVQHERRALNAHRTRALVDQLDPAQRGEIRSADRHQQNNVSKATVLMNARKTARARCDLCLWTH